MTIKIRAAKGKVLIVPEEYKPVETNLVLPQTACGRDMPQIGRVLAIGGRRITKKGVVLENEFKVGDRVFFRKFSGLWIDFRGHKLIQIAHSDILAILPDNGQ